MSREEFNSIHEVLQQKRYELRASAGPVAVAERSPDLDESAQAELLVSLAVERISADWHTLREIEAATARLEAGEYGMCEACGAAIPSKRLAAIPWARLCTPCQTVLEAAVDSQAVYPNAA